MVRPQRGLREAASRLAALQKYVHNREQRDELQAGQRWCELRIGELIGKGEEGWPTAGPGRGHKKTNTSPASEVFIAIPKDDRHKFRLMAQNKKIVEKITGLEFNGFGWSVHCFDASSSTR